jgi:uncharacterized paraquat-inducible protein A
MPRLRKPGTPAADVTHCPQCDARLSSTDALLIACGVESHCSRCEARVRTQRKPDPIPTSATIDRVLRLVEQHQAQLVCFAHVFLALSRRVDALELAQKARSSAEHQGQPNQGDFLPPAA